MIKLLSSLVSVLGVLVIHLLEQCTLQVSANVFWMHEVAIPSSYFKVNIINQEFIEIEISLFIYEITYYRIDPHYTVCTCFL